MQSERLIHVPFSGRVVEAHGRALANHHPGRCANDNRIRKPLKPLVETFARLEREMEQEVTDGPR